MQFSTELSRDLTYQVTGTDAREVPGRKALSLRVSQWIEKIVMVLRTYKAGRQYRKFRNTQREKG